MKSGTSDSAGRSLDVVHVETSRVSNCDLITLNGFPVLQC
jgi:hypothetical protein